MKLAMAEFHRDEVSASGYVLKLCKALGLSVSKNDLKRIVDLANGNKVIPIDLAMEIECVRKSGKAHMLQALLDSKDRFLNTPLSIGSTSMGIEFSSSYGSHTNTIKGPGYIEAPEISFSDDVIAYRKEAVAQFNAGNIQAFCRCYRAFLLSSVSLVDCFIHRYNFHIKMMVQDTSAYTNTDVLDSRKSLDERLDAWMTTFAFHKIDEFRESKYRSKFIELKRQRNTIVHPSNPTVPYSVKDVVKYFNYAQDGVGGLLSELRKYSGNTEHIGFISHVKTAPAIRILK